MPQTSKLNAQFHENPAFSAGKERARTYLRIGVELRRMRESEGLTQGELAGKTGLDQADISRLETGKWGRQGISFDVLERLLPVFGLRISHSVGPLGGADLSPLQLAASDAITELLHTDP